MGEISSFRLDENDNNKFNVVERKNEEFYGHIAWNTMTDEFVFHPATNSAFSTDRMNQIGAYLEFLNKYHSPSVNQH